MLSEPILVVARLVQAFDTLGVAYVVGGSLASSVYGVPRATQDVDLVADLEVSHAERLEQLLASDFYVDADMIRKAAAKRASFNVIHLTTMFKADVFVMKRDAWSREEMLRARREELDGPSGSVSIRFASPEDTLLHKLVWFRLGNEISDRQWSDILGVLKIQGERLDREYLERWAPVLNVADQSQISWRKLRASNDGRERRRTPTLKVAWPSLRSGPCSATRSRSTDGGGTILVSLQSRLGSPRRPAAALTAARPVRRQRRPAATSWRRD